jgi:drug/metabolite transporter (DMT)-like permease
MNTAFFGVVAGAASSCIFAAQFIAARYSLLASLTTFDIVALRIAPAGLLLLPAFVSQGLAKPIGLTWRCVLLLWAVGGLPYYLILYGGLALAPVAHGATINPGSAPVFVALIAWAALSEHPGFIRFGALFAVVVGLGLVSSFEFSASPGVVVGDLLFLLAGFLWGIFSILVRQWNVSPLHVATILSVPSLVYVPFYWLFMSPRLLEAPVWEVVFQAINLGVLNAMVGIYLFGLAVFHLGPKNASLFTAIVPVLAALMAVVLLGERPTAQQWTGIALVTGGVLIAAKAR